MSLTLQALGDKMVDPASAITTSETSLEAKLSNLDGNATAAQLLAFQLDLAKNNVIVSAYSSVAKERSDLYKGVVQKF